MALAPRVYVLGYPSRYGGADTELWHTLRLWRRFGLDVALIPTWHASPEHRARLDAIGVPTFAATGPDGLRDVPGLSGSIAVGFCNAGFLRSAHYLRAMGCRTVWANCMTWVFDEEVAHYQHHGAFDAYVFQSAFQQRELAPIYARYGADTRRLHLIRGAFCFDEFPFSPRSHRPGEAFLMGRIARDDLDKWSSNLWPIYSSVNYANKLARVMAWSPRLTSKCGAPPTWAEALTADTESAQQFLSTLHCLFAINGGAKENWPRAGLEAMSSGVPIVAQNEWGWREMIDHGETGFLGSDDRELAHFAAMLAHDENLRIRIALNARDRLETALAAPRVIWLAWKHLFASLTA